MEKEKLHPLMFVGTGSDVGKYDRLADLVRQHVDIPAVYRIQSKKDLCW